MSPMEKMDEIVRALEWAKRTGRLEYTRRTNLNGDYCDGVDAFDRALTLARELRDNAVEGWAHLDDSDEPYMWEVYEESYTRGVGRPAILITDPTP